MRLSLTRKQVESGPALELLRLLELITSDGKITEDEAAALQKWILDNQQIELPAVAFLKTLLDEILLKGQILHHDLRSLQIAAERVLPPERRDIAQARRTAVESENKRKQKEAVEADKKRAREYRELNRPESHFNFMVAGVSHQGRVRLILTYLHPNDIVYLAREPDNQYDRNAVAIRLASGIEVGYVPREHAEEMAPLLDKGLLQKSFCFKILTGGRLPIPVIIVDLYNPKATVSGAVPSDSIPAKTEAPPPPLQPPLRPDQEAPRAKSAPSGCSIVLVTGLLLVLFLFVIFLRVI